MYEIMAENYNWQVRRIKPGDKTGLDCHALKKGFALQRYKKAGSLCLGGEGKGRKVKVDNCG